MNDMNVKEVDFHTYCPLCEHSKKSEEDVPCCECLDEMSNFDSHKPVKFQERM